MFIHEGRETFVNFPSQIIKNTKTLNVFLPEPAIPMKGSYPVVYLLQADSLQAEGAKAFNQKAKQKVIFVGLNFTAGELRDRETLLKFFTQELIPYVNANYPTLNRPSQRVVAARGEGALLALEMLAKPEFISNAVLISPQGTAEFGGFLPASTRVYARGSRAELAGLQQQLDEAGLAYGKNYAYREGFYASVFDNLDLTYLFAAPAEAMVKKLSGKLSASSLVLGGDEAVTFTGSATLANGQKMDFEPVSFKISPMYLDWNAASGTLRALNGAEPGPVQLRVSVDNAAYTGRITLKKQPK